MKNENQTTLFNGEYTKDPEWKEHWQDMPEFVQEKEEAYAKIVFRFENEEDLQEFAKMIGQKLTRKTKSSWHPVKSHYRKVRYEWVDES